MLRSMTGFGKTTVDLKGKKVTIEIRSLNSRQLDLNLRISGALRKWENDIRSIVSGELGRGKVDVSVFLEYTGDSPASGIDRKLAKAYFMELKSLAKELKDKDESLLRTVLKMPDVMRPEKAEADEKEWKTIRAALEKAVAQLNKFRQDEGRTLQRDLESRIQSILKLLREIGKMDGFRVARIKDRLRQSVAELKGQVDANRFEQELIYYMEKLDITEEKVRLKTHCDYFLSAMNEKDSGRKLGFISQEIGREINTIGSKANDAAIQKLVVQMKDELEKIKEQVSNIL